MQHRRFIWLFLGICIGAYALLLGIGRSPLYCQFSRSYFDTAPCFKAGMKGMAADVLLVGDSSLLYGIRPDLVAAGSGSSVYNLGMVGPSFSYQVAGLIDRYLASNKRPRAIVLYFSPWEIISHDRIADPRWAPIGVYLLRHGGGGEIAHFLTVRPSAIVEMPPLIVGGLTMPGPRIQPYAAAMQAAGGYLHYDAGSSALSADCLPGTLKRPDGVLSNNRAALADLHRRYQARGIPLFTYIAPIAACDNEIDAVRHTYQGVADNLPLALPSEDFADDTPQANHVHASFAGVAVFSDRLAQFIRATVQHRLAIRP